MDGFLTVAEYADSRLRMLRPVNDWPCGMGGVGGMGGMAGCVGGMGRVGRDPARRLRRMGAMGARRAEPVDRIRLDGAIDLY